MNCFRIILMVASVATLATARVAPNPCCDGDNLLVGKKCETGVAIKLACSNGKYMLDPSKNDEDEYRVTDQGILVYGDNDIKE